MPDSSHPSDPRSRSGDDWSDTSWSDPSYRKPTQNGRSGADWGSPSYSGGPRERGARDTDSGSTRAGRPVGARTATRDRPDPSEAPRRPADRQPRDRQDRDRQPRERPSDNRRLGPEDWAKGGPTSSREQRATRAADRRAELEAERTRRSVERLRTQADDARLRTQPKPPERGIPWWGALVVLVAITLLGALIDSIGNIDGQNGFNYGIVVATIVAIAAVKRSQMFPVVVAPPIVYALAAMLQLYIKTRGSSGSRSSLLIDAVQNYLVYGFPALAAATAAGLIIAGIRLVIRR